MKVLLAVLAWAVASTSAFAAPSSVGVITNPDWVSLPNGAHMAYAYPKAASWVGVEGRAIIQCDVTDLGRLTGCQAISESPAGLGFGAAALQLAQYFQMSPRKVDGRPIAGGQVRVPIAFRLPDQPKPSPAASAGSPPTAEALALAKRLVVAMELSKQHRDQFEFRVRSDRDFIETVKSLHGEAALDAWRRAIAEASDRYVELATDAFARTFSTAELKQIAEFHEGPAGRAWLSRRELAWNAMQPHQEVFERSIRQTARRLFCEKLSCDSVAAAPGGSVAEPARSFAPP